ncbi:5165_t:CDS:10 [Paraglomus occultum]|uniref:5165_t:CDS:1 n=1 Tax=Paraglomus occultum TaxID=144539 RepID=A0A9N8Z612_9GLOM|nr:5165_t:CDS:10 [Paraglomus occultum]
MNLLQPVPQSTLIAQKRFKPIETCDNCKERKVKCDKGRPVCGTCKKTNRDCTYDYSASSKRGRPKNEYELLQEQLEDIQTSTFQQVDRIESILEMALSGVPQGNASDTNLLMTNGNIYNNTYNNSNNDNVNDNNMSEWRGLYPNVASESASLPSLNLNLSEETLYLSTQLAASLPRQPHQEDNTVVDSDLFIGHPFAMLENNALDQLTDKMESLNIFESNQYVGEGSLLLLNDGGDELILPRCPANLSQVEQDLKCLPGAEIVDLLIDLYYQKIYRHYPHMKKSVLDSLGDLSTPQHFLLLNSIMFAASPFHPSEEHQKNGIIYHQRAVALLQRHCMSTPHVLTVISLFILGLNTRKMGSAWIFLGMASKMAFELGLHRKIKSPQMTPEVKEMRDMAFWGCFVSEAWASACYGRPSAIDEAMCDVDLLPIPQTPEPDLETRLHIAWILHIDLLRIFAQVRKYLYGRAKIAGTRREESQFKFLDAVLGKWSSTLPQWLRFEEMTKDVKNSLLGSIGGEMHTLFWTVIILLHSRNLAMFTTHPNNPLLRNMNDPSILLSQTMCVHAATILLHLLDVLMNTVPDFYEQSCAALFSFAPAIRVLSWTAQRGDEKSMQMVERLKEIKDQVKEIARNFAVRAGLESRLEGEEKLHKWWSGKEEEAKNAHIQDGDFTIVDPVQYRKQYSYISKKGKNAVSNKQINNEQPTSYNYEGEFTFTFKHQQSNDSNRFVPHLSDAIVQQQLQQSQQAPHVFTHQEQQLEQSQPSVSLQQVPQLSLFTLDNICFGANDLAGNHDLSQQHNDADIIPSFDPFNGGNFHIDENGAQELWQ